MQEVNFNSVNAFDETNLFELNETKRTLSQAVSEAAKSLKAVTKILKIQKISKSSVKRKLVISTNLLRPFCFSKGTKVVEEVIGFNQGLKIRLAREEDTDIKRVYERKYANRANEIQTDTRSQSKLNEAFGIASSVHITFTMGCLYIVPIFENQTHFNNVPILLNLKNNIAEGEIDTSIFNAIEYIEQLKARKVFIKSDSSNFFESKQANLLVLQLRRFGYKNIEKCVGDYEIVAAMNDYNFDSNTYSQSYDVFQLCKNDRFRDEVLSRQSAVSSLNTFFMMSSGIDMFAMRSEGFKPLHLIDYRPIESRDNKTVVSKGGNKTKKVIDKTEIGAVCALLNNRSLINIFNEDIYHFSYSRVAQLIESQEPIGVVHASLQCDDFSFCKNESDKERAIDELSTTVDMFIPLLRNFIKIKAPVLVVENVPAFMHDAIIFGLTKAYLEKFGYKVSVKVMSALDYNGYSSRKRMMLCASMYGTFLYPCTQERTVNLWDDYVVNNLERFRCVSHTQIVKMIKAGKEVYDKVKLKNLAESDLSKSERTVYRKYKSSNLIKPFSGYSGTILKSQNRQVAESLMLVIDDRTLFPDTEVLTFITGLDSNFNFAPFTKEEITEFLGQGVDIPLHKAFSNSLIKHIDKFYKKFVKTSHYKFEQLALF